jgi:hypothetical protein
VVDLCGTGCLTVVGANNYSPLWAKLEQLVFMGDNGEIEQYGQTKIECRLDKPRSGAIRQA